MVESPTWGDAFRTGSADAMGAYRDTLLDPLFRPWAQELLAMVRPQQGERLLDVATGPGTVAQAAAAMLGPAGRVTACDISPSMLSIARAHPVDPDGAPIEYVESPAAPLAAPSGSYDVVTCQQGMQFVPDRDAAVAEMFRVLRPGGRLAIAVWNAIEECPPMAALQSALRDLLGDDIADRYGAGPWGLPDGQFWGLLLRTNGFDDVQVEKRAVTSVFPGGASQLSASLPASGVAAEVAALSAEERAELDRRIVHHLTPLMAGDAVEAVLHSNVATGIKPVG